jgi:hypothetical protein
MSKKADRGPPSPEAAVVALCLQIIDSFNADRVTPTTHADVFLAAQKNLAQDDEVFIRQVTCHSRPARTPPEHLAMSRPWGGWRCCGPRPLKIHFRVTLSTTTFC